MKRKKYRCKICGGVEELDKLETWSNLEKHLDRHAIRWVPDASDIHVRAIHFFNEVSEEDAKKYDSKQYWSQVAGTYFMRKDVHEVFDELGLPWYERRINYNDIAMATITYLRAGWKEEMKRVIQGLGNEIYLHESVKELEGK